MFRLHLAFPAALVALVASAPGQGFSERERVWSTFDADGRADHFHLPKLPDGPGPHEPEGDEAPPSYGGGPPNDLCGDATVIPGSMVSYSPGLLNTTTALTSLCGAVESCESGGVGTSNDVWYSYTPDRDGLLTVDTIGSDYDTVLSIHTGCGTFGFPCNLPDELACSDDWFFSDQSLVSLDVYAGTTYIIKVADLDTDPGGGLLDFDASFAPRNQLCSAATTITGTVFEDLVLPTQNAATEACEASESCEFNGVGTSNSVYYEFVPPCDGFVSVNTNGSTYDTVLSIHDGCAGFVGIDIPCELPVELACDDDGGTGLASQLVDVPVTEGEEILIKVADYNLDVGGGSMNLAFVFEGAAPPVAQIDSPSNFDCACESVAVTGTASTGSALMAGWQLETRPLDSDVWTLVAEDTTEVVSGALGTWSSSLAAEGYHMLRLTVTNACGASDSDTVVVYVEQGAAVVALDEPGEGAVLGGLACASGTAADQCFSGWTLEVGDLFFTPVSSGTGQVIGGNLTPGGWDTTTLADGDYKLRLRITDACGNVIDDSRSITIDNTAPVADIIAPRDCVLTDGVVTIRGTVTDDRLAGWSLSYSSGGDWVPIASGSSNVVDGVLGSLDLGALPPCGYTLRLLAWDAVDVNCGQTRIVEDLLSLSNQSTVLTQDGLGN